MDLPPPSITPNQNPPAGQQPDQQKNSKSIKYFWLILGALTVLIIIFTSVLVIRHLIQPKAEQVEQEKAQVLTTQLVQLKDQYNRASGKEKEEKLQEMVAVAKERKEELKNLMEASPAAVLQQAIPEDQRDQFPQQVKQYLESSLNTEGKLTTIHTDNFVKNISESSSYFTVSEQEMYRLHFVQTTQLPTGSVNAKVEGIVLDYDGVVSKINIVSSKSILGVQTTLLCADGTNDKVYSSNMAGCDGQATGGTSSSLCAAEAHVCSVAEYVAEGGGVSSNPNDSKRYLSDTFSSQTWCDGSTRSVLHTGGSNTIATMPPGDTPFRYNYDPATCGTANLGWFGGSSQSGAGVVCCTTASTSTATPTPTSQPTSGPSPSPSLSPSPTPTATPTPTTTPPVVGILPNFAPVTNINVALIIVRKPESTYTPFNMTVDQIKNAVNAMMFTDTNSVKNFYQETSFNQVTISGNIFGPYTLTGDPSLFCNFFNSPWVNDVNQAIASSGVDINSYNRKFYLYLDAMCGVGGAADYLAFASGTRVLNWQTLAHELGHTIGYVANTDLHGLAHANRLLLDMDNKPVDSRPLIEYEDYSDVMGGRGVLTFQLNAPHKVAAGWIPSVNIRTVSTDGTYNIANIETNTSSTQVLRIAKGTRTGGLPYNPATGQLTPKDDYYYISFRKALGFDLGLMDFTEGVTIHVWNEDMVIVTKQIEFVDPNTGFGPSFFRTIPTLTDGTFFYDPASKILVTQLSHNTDSVTVQIQFNASAPAASSPPPLSSQPCRVVDPGRQLLGSPVSGHGESFYIAGGSVTIQGVALGNCQSQQIQFKAVVDHRINTTIAQITPAPVSLSDSNGVYFANTNWVSEFIAQGLLPTNDVYVTAELVGLNSKARSYEVFKTIAAGSGVTPTPTPTPSPIPSPSPSPSPTPSPTPTPTPIPSITPNIVVTTGSGPKIVDNLTSFGAKIYGTFYPDGKSTNAWFRYKILPSGATVPVSCEDTDSFGIKAPVTPVNYNDSAVHEYFATLTSLTSSSGYYFCAIAQAATNIGTSTGKVYGVVESFATLANQAPVIEGITTVTYPNNLTRTGAHNTPFRLSFQATDIEQTAADQLTYYIHTGPNKKGTQISTSKLTSGSAVSIPLPYNQTGLINGSNILYLSIYDGRDYAAANPSFTVLRDDTPPQDATGISHRPNPITSAKQYTLTFTPHDDLSASTNELYYEIRTISNGGGDGLTSGSATGNTAVTTATMTDSGLAEGQNSRYLRIRDGAGNVKETQFTLALLVSRPPPCSDLGDVNEDGTVGPDDINLIQEHVVDGKILTDEQKKRADVNGDNKINISDASNVQRYLTGLVTTFNLCQIITISNISSTSIKNLDNTNTATITWQTSVPAKGRVFYGLTRNNLTAASADSLYKTTHAVNLTKLLGKLYFYKIKSGNGAGEVEGPLRIFKTRP